MSRIEAAAPWIGQEPPELDLGFGDLFDVLIRRKWMVLGIALVVMAASLFSAAGKGTTYSSKASVLLASATQSSVEAQQLLATQKQLATSRAVATIVLHNLRRPGSPDELLKGLSVSVPLNTQLIVFRYASPKAGDAKLLAQAFVDAFVQYQGQLLDGLVESSRSIDKLADSLRSRLAQAQVDAAGATNPVDKSLANARVDSLAAQIAVVEHQRSTLLSSALVSTTLAEHASPAVRNPPPYKRAGVIGLAAGLVVGAFAAFAVEFGSRRKAKRNPARAARS